MAFERKKNKKKQMVQYDPDCDVFENTHTLIEDTKEKCDQLGMDLYIFDTTNYLSLNDQSGLPILHERLFAIVPHKAIVDSVFWVHPIDLSLTYSRSLQDLQSSPKERSDLESFLRFLDLDPIDFPMQLIFHHGASG